MAGLDGLGAEKATNGTRIGADLPRMMRIKNKQSRVYPSNPRNPRSILSYSLLCDGTRSVPATKACHPCQLCQSGNCFWQTWALSIGATCCEITEITEITDITSWPSR